MKDKMENNFYQEEVARQSGDRAGRRKRRRGGRAIFAMLGSTVAMAAVLYLTVTVCVWIDKKVQANAGALVGGEGNSLPGNEAVSGGNNATGDKAEGSNLSSVGGTGEGDGAFPDGNGMDGTNGTMPGGAGGADGPSVGGSGLDGANGSTPGDGGSTGPEGASGQPGDVVDTMGHSKIYSQEELDHQLGVAREQAMMDVLGSIRTGLSEGDTVLETIRPLFPEEIVVYSGGKYHFVPINRQLKQNQWEQENLEILESGELRYLQDGEVISYKGIDVSRHQGKIDWQQVAQDGVEFAFIRAGYRGYGNNGTLVEDDRFEENIQGAIAAGIKVGVYFYSQAITEEEALEEAELVLNKIAPYKIDCPVVFDVEKVTGADGRMNNISVEERTRITEVFCQAIENAGYRPMIYYNTEMGALMLGIEALEGYEKWFAAYSDEFYYPYEYKVWQYSQTGRVLGIQGDVDLNISFVPLWEE